MISEAAFRRKVVKALKPLHAIPVENPVSYGTPDVNFCHGWLELKVDRWLCDGTLPLRHFTPQQKIWLRMRHRAGGAALLLVLTPDDILLLNGEQAFDAPGKPGWWFANGNLEALWPQWPGDESFLEAIRNVSRRLSGARPLGEKPAPGPLLA